MNTKFFGEFSYELAAVIPYAYYLYQNKLLTETNAPPGTSSLYYFSPKHTESGSRGLLNSIKDDNINHQIYESTLNVSKWVPPPYKEHYKNRWLIFNKPSFIISNKHQDEWGRGVKNHFPKKFLDRVISDIKDKYQVIYIRPTGTERGYSPDHNKILPLDDHDFIRKKHPEVLIFNDFLKLTDIDYNKLQLMIHANTTKFLSVSGGNSIFCSYFGGDNIIYQKEGNLKSASLGWFKRLSGTNIHFTESYDEAFECLKNIV